MGEEEKHICDEVCADKSASRWKKGRCKRLGYCKGEAEEEESPAACEEKCEEKRGWEKDICLGKCQTSLVAAAEDLEKEEEEKHICDEVCADKSASRWKKGRCKRLGYCKGEAEGEESHAACEEKCEEKKG